MKGIEKQQYIAEHNGNTFPASSFMGDLQIKQHRYIINLNQINTGIY